MEHAGFRHLALVEIDSQACSTLKFNRPDWNVLQEDLRAFSGTQFRGVDLLGGGVPCPPFSVAGKQLGAEDERNLFPEALRIVEESKPRAVLFENVRGLMASKFNGYRKYIERRLEDLGYTGSWSIVNAADFGVPQIRWRTTFTAFREDAYKYYSNGVVRNIRKRYVGETLHPYLKQKGWLKADSWASCANALAPTIVGGSKKHGGPDLGPTRAKKAWQLLGIDAHGIADSPPERDFQGMPRLTVEMAAAIQGFPDDWRFVGSKTQVYRQIGNAFPPPVARWLGKRIADALSKKIGAADILATAN